MESQNIRLDLIDLDASPHGRVGLDTDVLIHYSRVMKAQVQWPFPPVDAFWDEGREKFLIGDGHHRVQAAIDSSFAAVLANCHAGGFEAAELCAIGANRRHGNPATLADCVRQARLAIQHPAFRNRPDSVIASQTGLPPEVISYARWMNRKDQPDLANPRRPAGPEPTDTIFRSY